MRPSTWKEIRRSPVRLGKRLTDALKAIGRENPKLQGVIDRRDLKATEGGQRRTEADQ